MANTHQVVIRGELPFHITEHEESRNWLGLMNGPSFGLRVSYGRERYIPNKNGGKTATFEFSIEGTEAIWDSGLLALIKAFEDGGATISYAVAKDLDFPTDWYSLIGES